MSNGQIRTLFNDKLIEGLRQPDDTLKYPVLKNGVQDISLTDTHVIPHLIPAPVLNGTLGGDHQGFTGIYQMTIKATNGIESSDPTIDISDTIDEVVAEIQKVFPINARIGEEGVFVVQVLSTISVTEATCERRDSWWQAHAYFSYRADTN